MSAAAIPVHCATRSGVYSGKPLLQFVEAVGITRDVVGIVQAFAHNDMHQSERQRDVGAGIDGDMPIGDARRACAVRIDHHQLSAVACRASSMNGHR